MEQLVGMEGTNKMSRLFLITLLSFILSGCSSSEQSSLAKPSQTPVVALTKTPTDEDSKSVHVVKDGGEFCENYLLKRDAKDRMEDSKVVKLKAFNTNDKNLSLDLKKWLEDMDEEKLVAYELQHDEKRVLLLRSFNRSATGLASNFQFWFIQYNNYSVGFRSLAREPKLVFWDKDGLLNYYYVKYSSEFVENKDWNNLTLDLLRYKISPDGQSQLVSEERNVKCE
jgi:hypothetical protein